MAHSILSWLQPRSSIFELFDDLLLLSEGRAVYAGPAAAAVGYFAARGHPCPERFNPAEVLADLISIDTSSPEAERMTRCQQSVMAPGSMRETHAVHQQIKRDERR